jgi:hypothetical protein
MTVSAYGLPQFVQTRLQAFPKKRRRGRMCCVDVNLRQSTSLGNRNLDKPWFRASRGSFENWTVQFRGLGLGFVVAWLVLRMETGALAVI